MSREMSDKDIAEAHILLIGLIAKHPKFRVRAQELQEQYPKLSDWLGYPGLAGVVSRDNPEASGEDVVDYCNSILDLTKQFNLITKSGIPCDWAPELIHDFVRGFNKHRLTGTTWTEILRVSMSEPVSRDNHIEVTLQLLPNASKADAQKELTRNWEEIDQALRSLPGQEDRSRRPHARPSVELKKHMEWFYQHLIMEKTSLEIYGDLQKKVKILHRNI